MSGHTPGIWKIVSSVDNDGNRRVSVERIQTNPNENIPGRHRFGEDYTPVTFREFMRDANWWLVGAIVFLLGFWVWVGYNVVRWVP